jgi:hypothetical protein
MGKQIPSSLCMGNGWNLGCLVEGTFWSINNFFVMRVDISVSAPLFFHKVGHTLSYILYNLYEYLADVVYNRACHMISIVLTTSLFNQREMACRGCSFCFSGFSSHQMLLPLPFNKCQVNFTPRESWATCLDWERGKLEVMWHTSDAVSKYHLLHNLVKNGVGFRVGLSFCFFFLIYLKNSKSLGFENFEFKGYKHQGSGFTKPKKNDKFLWISTNLISKCLGQPHVHLATSADFHLCC